MKPSNNCDKLSMVKLLTISKMLQQESCVENFNKTSKKSSTNIKHKNNITPNNSSVKKNAKYEVNTNSTLPVQEVNVEDDSGLIPPICDKLNMLKLLIILKILHQSYCNETFNETSKKSSTNINHKNNINPNNLGEKTNAKINTEYILPIQDVIVKDNLTCINKKVEINNNTTNGIYEIPKNINTYHSKNFISTFPIIIAEKSVDIPIESSFKLKNAALDIKAMKKDVYLTNSTLLPLYGKYDISPSLNGKLFLEGFVRNKLDFSIAKGVNDSIINLDTESVIIYIPFKCTTLIQYKSPPVLSKEKTLDYIPIYISSNCADVTKDYNENFNEYINCDIQPINCEIKEAKIFGTYTLVDKKPFNKDFPVETNFHTIKENIIINLSLTLLQKQDVAINYRKSPK